MSTINQNSSEKHEEGNNNKIHINPPQEPSSKENLAENKNEKIEKDTKSIKESIPDEDLEYEKIKNSRFKQQRLPAWRPVPTILSIIIVFSFFGIVFIILGILILLYSYKIKSQEVDYTDKCENNEYCIVNIIIEEKIPKPVFVYYQLDGFFQNARRYVKSKQVGQLTGDNFKTAENCEPFETNKKMGFNDEKLSINSNTLNSEEIAIPCGLMAKTFFNDTFNFSINGKYFEVNETNIAFEKDKEIYKDKSPEKQWISLENEHFLIWMRPSGLPNPRKLWGKIDQDLNKGDIITINITNNYDVSYYEGKKKIILSNTTIFGGKNTFLALCYIIVGGLSLISSIIFPIGYKIQMNKEKES